MRTSPFSVCLTILPYHTPSERIDDVRRHDRVRTYLRNNSVIPRQKHVYTYATKKNAFDVVAVVARARAKIASCCLSETTINFLLNK